MTVTFTVIHFLIVKVGSLEMGLGTSNIDLNLALLPRWLWYFMSIIYS